MKICEMTETSRDCATCPVNLIHKPDACPDVASRREAAERIDLVAEYLLNASLMTSVMREALKA